MESKKKKKFKESFRKYLKAENEKSDCDDPCKKNGKSDRYCLKCSNEIMGGLLTK